MSAFERADREERFLASKTAAEANNSTIVPIRGIAVSNRPCRELGRSVLRGLEFIYVGQCLVTYFIFGRCWIGFWLLETEPSALCAIWWHISVHVLVPRL